MTIDTNTIVLFVVSALAGFFAVGYFRMKFNEKFTAMQRHHDDNMSEVFDTQNRIFRDIHALEKKVDCCRNSKNQPCDKNFYNTENNQYLKG